MIYVYYENPSDADIIHTICLHGVKIKKIKNLWFANKDLGDDESKDVVIKYKIEKVELISNDVIYNRKQKLNKLMGKEFESNIIDGKIFQ